MKTKNVVKHIFMVCLAFILQTQVNAQTVTSNEIRPYGVADESEAIFNTRQYRNIFVEMGKTEAEVEAKMDEMVGKFFRGEDGGGWQIYQEVGSDMAYIHTVDTDDVRSEGMSYGMMIALQLDMQEEFNRLWNWTKTYMQHQQGEREGYFAWQVGINGNVIDANPAPDGEEYFALALFFAANRWGNGTGTYNYEYEANEILDDMIRHKQKRGLTWWNGSAVNMIDEDEKQIVLSTIGQSADYTNPSYHLPHFYELFHTMADPDLVALWEEGEEEDGDIPARKGITWLEMADVSRQHFRDATHPETGLAPAYSNFDGTPNGSNPGVMSDIFSYDSWRVGANIAQDYLWFKKDDWQKETWAPRYLGFFYNEGVSTHGNLFELNGTQHQHGADHSPGLVAMNAVAATIWDDPKSWEFVEELWNITPTEGTYRYYDGMLYLFGMLNLSGNYRIYDGVAASDPDPDPIHIPGRVEAENYLSMSGIEVESNNAGVDNIGSINSGDWARYVINVSESGSYVLLIKVASAANSNNDIVVKNSLGETLGTLTVDASKTTGWNDWYVDSIVVDLTIGEQEIDFEFQGSSDYLFNIDWFEFSHPTTSIATMREFNTRGYSVNIAPNPFMGEGKIVFQTSESEKVDIEMYNLSGKLVYKRSVISSSANVNTIEIDSINNLKRGIYYIILKSDNKKRAVKAVIKI